MFYALCKLIFTTSTASSSDASETSCRGKVFFTDDNAAPKPKKPMMPPPPPPDKPSKVAEACAEKVLEESVVIGVEKEDKVTANTVTPEPTLVTTTTPVEIDAPAGDVDIHAVGSQPQA